METLSELLFELANVDRLMILEEIRENAQNLTPISKTLDLTLQETSRHMHRLSDARLVAKQPDGTYQITNYGSSIMMMLPGLDFLVQYREYFLSHDIEVLPAEFLLRIGELHGSKLLNNPVRAFQEVNNIIEKAKKYVWFVADEIPTGSIPLIEAAVKRGMRMQFLVPKNLSRPNLPDTYFPEYSNDDRSRLLLGWSNSIDIVGVISERAAVMGFPTADGKMDYLAFFAESANAVKWCRDVYSFYWRQVEPSMPESNRAP